MSRRKKEPAAEAVIESESQTLADATAGKIEERWHEGAHRDIGQFDQTGVRAQHGWPEIGHRSVEDGARVGEEDQALFEQLPRKGQEVGLSIEVDRSVE